MSYDGHIYPEWSGLNSVKDSIDLYEVLKDAINTVRYVWKDESRASREMLARHITGSECIILLHALERAITRTTPTPIKKATPDA